MAQCSGNGRTSVETLVIGGGVVGLGAAFFLQEAGQQVLLIDRDVPGRGASGLNPGSLAVQNKPVRLIPMAIEGVNLWRELHAMEGCDVGYHQSGGFRIAESEEEASELKQLYLDQREKGANLQHLRGTAITDIAPYLSLDQVVAANYCPDDGYGNPLVALPSLVKAFERLGGVVQTKTEAISISERGNSVIVETNRGRIEAGKVVAAAGVLSRKLMSTVGFDVPVEARAMQVMVTEPVAPCVTHMLTHVRGNLTMKQKQDVGTVLIGGGRDAVIRASDPYHADLLLHNLSGNAHAAARVVPQLEQVKIIRAWGGIDGRTPDLMPIMGRVPGHKRIWLSTSCTGGYTIGPLLGRSIANAILGRPIVDPVKEFLDT